MIWVYAFSVVTTALTGILNDLLALAPMHNLMNFITFTSYRQTIRDLVWCTNQ